MANGNHSFYFVGNLLCLDLVNTEIIARGERIDLITGFADLVQWLRAATALKPAQARLAEKRWGNTTDGRTAFNEAVGLRSALRAMAERITTGKPVDRTSIEPINRVLASRPAYR